MKNLMNQKLDELKEIVELTYNNSPKYYDMLEFIKKENNITTLSIDDTLKEIEEMGIEDELLSIDMTNKFNGTVETYYIVNYVDGLLHCIDKNMLLEVKSIIKMYTTQISTIEDNIMFLNYIQD